MSANNIVVIKESEDNPRFRIEDRCAETNYPGYTVGTADNIEDAVKIAHKYMEEEIVEYGMTVKLLNK